MLGMTGFAVLCGFFALLPDAFGHILIGSIWIAATGWLITGLVFAKGDQRAFCIGAVVVVSSSWTGIGGRFLDGVTSLLFLLTSGMPLPSEVSMLAKHVALAAAAVANGYFCIRARHYFERHADE